MVMQLKKSRHRAPIELPSSPVWGYLLVGIMAVLVLAGLFLLLSPSQNLEGIGGGCIGVVEVNGPIVATSTPASLFSEGQSGSSEIIDLIEEAEERDDIKSILLVVNSPGGSVVGSDEIYRKFEAAKKPKVAYFRETAASAGYYISLGADYIISEPNSLTGSIGARMTLMQLKELFGKIGYNETTIKSGEYKDIGNYARELKPEEREILQGIVDESFESFKSKVLQKREGKLDASREDEIFDGRIMTGRQALGYGLVDSLGSKKDALKKASSLAGAKEELEACKLQKKQPSFFGSLLSSAKSLFSPVLDKQGASLEFR